MVVGIRRVMIGGPIGLGAELRLSATLGLPEPALLARGQAADDPYERPSYRARPLPDGPCSYRATGSKRSRRRQAAKGH